MFRAEVVLKWCLLLAGCAITISAFAQFEARSTTSIAGEPLSVAVADFNHDGKLDVAVANYNGQLAILLGRGDGTFRPAAYYPVSYAESIAAADFNHDGNMDLAVADGLSDYVTVLLGNGDGTFQSPITVPLNGVPFFVAVGDFNGDHIPDLVAAEESPCNCISVLLGNGDGTFQEPLDNASFAPGGIAIGDFNRDGNLDVATAHFHFSQAEYAILLGNGDGTLQSAAVTPLSFVPNSIVTADLNRDGKLDLAIGGAGLSLSVLLGNGDGTFQAETDYTTPYAENSVAVADFNGDGKPDIAVLGCCNPSLPGHVTMFLGNGDGTFLQVAQFPAGKGSAYLSAVDLNGDYKPDLVIPALLGDAVDVLLNTGVVSFLPNTPLSFHAQIIGTTSAPQNVTLTNTGTTALSIASKRVSGPFQLASGTTCGSSVAPGANCTLSVTFTPTVIGLKSGLLSISDSASSKPQVIELSGAGTVISLSPTHLDFGSQKVGTKSVPQTVTVTNTGSTTVNVSSVKIEGLNPKDYSQTNTCVGQIGPGASCTISVTFAPTKTGTRIADAHIDDNGGGAPQIVPLTGTGT